MPLLRAWSRLGLSVADFWNAELWEIAAALGVGEPEQQPATPGLVDGQGRPLGSQQPRPTSITPTGRDLIAERVAYVRGVGPKPEPDPDGNVARDRRIVGDATAAR